MLTPNDLTAYLEHLISFETAMPTHGFAVSHAMKPVAETRDLSFTAISLPRFSNLILNQAATRTRRVQKFISIGHFALNSHSVAST